MVERWKAKLVAFFDTYAPVARMTSCRVIYALHVYLHLFTESMDVDVDVAFLNAELKEDVYIEPPARYKPVPKGMVLKANKALMDLNSRQGNGIWLWTSSYGRILK